MQCNVECLFMTSQWTFENSVTVIESQNATLTLFHQLLKQGQKGSKAEPLKFPKLNCSSASASVSKLLGLRWWPTWLSCKKTPFDNKLVSIFFIEKSLMVKG